MIPLSEKREDTFIAGLSMGGFGVLRYGTVYSETFSLCGRAVYTGLIDSYQQTMNGFVGPTKVLVSGDTLQLKDYSKTDWPWSMFDPEAKQKRHDCVFPEEMKKAYEMGKALV